MIERAITQIRRLGTRAEALGTCPVCGHGVEAGKDPVRAWAGKYAHRDCASYVRRSRRRDQSSQRVHSRFTAT